MAKNVLYNDVYRMGFALKLITFVGLLLMMNVASLTLAEQILVVIFVLYASLSAGLVMENNPIAIYLEWVKYLLVLITLLMYSLPEWIEWALGISMLINVVVLLFKKNDIINSTGPLMEANN